MTFNDHKKLRGLHAFLGASNYHWLNYSDEKLAQRWESLKAVERGTQLHEFAAKAIELGITQKSNGNPLNMYINDAIGFRMTPEQTLFYSENCFGTADAISFRNEKKRETLRIHDLKTGEIPAKMDQLRIYAALFCLEYGIKPGDIFMELRIYQLRRDEEGNPIHEPFIENPEPEDILPIMDKIERFDKIITKLNNGG